MGSRGYIYASSDDHSTASWGIVSLEPTKYFFCITPYIPPNAYVIERPGASSILARWTLILDSRLVTIDARS